MSTALDGLDDDKRDKLARFAQGILGDPELSGKVRRLVKQKDPNFRDTKDIDLEDRIDETRTKLTEENQKLREEMQADRINRQWATEQEKIKSAGFGVDYITKLMKDEGIANIDTAIRHAQMMAQTAPPTPSSLEPDVLPATADNKELWQDPKKWREKQLRLATNDLINQRQGRR